jgi:hypothetical protein
MLSACGQILNEADLLHFRYGSRVALSTLSPIRYLLRPKTRFPVRRLHLLSGREFHPLEAPGLSWRTVVEIHVGQQWRGDCALRRALLAHSQFTLFHHACLQPFVDQAQDTLIADPMLQKFDQPLVTDRIKEALQIRIHNPSRAAG